MKTRRDFKVVLFLVVPMRLLQYYGIGARASAPPRDEVSARIRHACNQTYVHY